MPTSHKHPSRPVPILPTPTTMSYPRRPHLAAVLLATAVLVFSGGANCQAPSLPPAGAPTTMPTTGAPIMPVEGPVAPSPGMDCSTPLANLTDCLTYVEAGSTTTTPDKGCCPAFAGFVESNPICLCHLLGSGEVFGLKIDTAKALKLPTACHVVTPSVSLCSAFGIPVPSPMGPAMAPASGGPSPSSGGIGANPTGAPTSAGSGVEPFGVTVSLLVGVVAVAMF